jgi:hypothetical protein
MSGRSKGAYVAPSKRWVWLALATTLLLPGISACGGSSGGLNSDQRSAINHQTNDPISKAIHEAGYRPAILSKSKGLASVVIFDVCDPDAGPEGCQQKGKQPATPEIWRTLENEQRLAFQPGADSVVVKGVRQSDDRPYTCTGRKGLTITQDDLQGSLSLPSQINTLAGLTGEVTIGPFSCHPD